ncbi:hypothetical protein CRYUN_Cryun25bG0031100 [Craigia yunnanensis]
MCFGASSTTVDEDNNCDSSIEVLVQEEWVTKLISIESIFTDFEDVDVCISQAADFVGLKEIPRYEVKTGELCDWIKKTQIDKGGERFLDHGTGSVILAIAAVTFGASLSVGELI